MTDNIVPLRPEKRDPHVSGKARCLACKHEWVAVAPVGTIDFECPSCGLMRGAWMYPVQPHRDEKVWQCACGATTFWFLILADGSNWLTCVGCGKDHQPWR